MPRHAIRKNQMHRNNKKISLKNTKQICLSRIYVIRHFLYSLTRPQILVQKTCVLKHTYIELKFAMRNTLKREFTRKRSVYAIVKHKNLEFIYNTMNLFFFALIVYDNKLKSTKKILNEMQDRLSKTLLFHRYQKTRYFKNVFTVSYSCYSPGTIKTTQTLILQN